jgi:hypothetical protein
VSRPGSNLPDFRAAQLAFAAHIRNPEDNPAPADIEPRRMKIYLELFYNNIEGFLASGFPVLKRVLGEERWHALTREFIHRHPSESPYFLEISQEYLAFLNERGTEDLPLFVLELAHYEWVELALSVDERVLPDDGIDPDGDLLAAKVMVSPLIWKLAYRWPVHQIGPDHLPDVMPDSPTSLIVYRRRDDEVRFMSVNPTTLRLLELLESGQTGTEALRALAAELDGVDSKVVYEQGIATMERLREAQIILGSERDSGDGQRAVE